jgi:hypothetical protein
MLLLKAPKTSYHGKNLLRGLHSIWAKGSWHGSGFWEKEVLLKTFSVEARD